MSHRALPLARLILVGLVAVACATSPLGRRQLLLFPEPEMAAMGVAAYDKMKSELPSSRDTAKQAYVRCVADSITRVLSPAEGPRSWEVTLFQDDSANAFALPGGKIGVHTGLLTVARSQHQLAAVIGHEIAHVLAKHSNERVSNAYATQTGVDLASVLTGATTPMQRELLGLLGAAAVTLPFSRTQESEADVIGLELMARAGFDPRASLELWQNMAAQGGAQPPEFLSTHPSHGRRIQELSQRIPEVMPLYEQARAGGRRPSCG